MAATLETSDRTALLAEVTRVQEAHLAAARQAADLMDERDDLFLAIQEDPSVSISNVELAAAAGVTDGRIGQAQGKARERQAATRAKR